MEVCLKIQFVAFLAKFAPISHFEMNEIWVLFNVKYTYLNSNTNYTSKLSTHVYFNAHIYGNRFVVYTKFIKQGRQSKSKFIVHVCKIYLLFTSPVKCHKMYLMPSFL